MEEGYERSASSFVKGWWVDDLRLWKSSLILFDVMVSSVDCLDITRIRDKDNIILLTSKQMKDSSYLLSLFLGTIPPS